MHYDQPLSRILHHDLLECPPQTPVAEAAARMHVARCGSILVVDKREVQGIWTDRDALKLDIADPESLKQPIARVMSTPVKTILDVQTVAEAAIRFKQEGIRHLLVVDGHGRRLGIVTQTDIVNHQGVEFYVRMREVNSVVKDSPPLVPSDMPMVQVLAAMKERKSDAVIVQDGGRWGLLTGRDVLRLICEGLPHRTAGDMASFPLMTVPRRSTLYHARKLFDEHRIRHLGVVDTQGQVVGLLSYADILESVEQEYVAELQAALQEQSLRLERSYHALLLASKVAETSHQAIMIVDEENVIQSVNPAFTAITGYLADEAVGKKTRLLKSGLHDDAFYQAMYASLKQHGLWNGEVWNRRKNGEIFPESLTITEVRGSNGKLLSYVCVFTDVTEQKRVREDLQQSKEKLAQQSSLTEMILDTLPAMVFVKDEVGRYLMMNQAAADFVGRNRGEVAGLSDFDLFPAEMAARVHQGDLNALASPQVQEEEVLHRTVGGPRYLLTHKRSVQIGDSRYLISSSSDITERRQTVNLLAAEKHVLELIAGDASLAVVLDAVCRSIESLIADSRVVLLFYDGLNETMTLGAAPTLGRGCCRITEQCPAAGQGCVCAQAAHSGRLVEAMNLQEDPSWGTSQAFARAKGFNSAWSNPILAANREVLGTVTLFFRGQRRLSGGEEEVISHLSHLASIAVERDRAIGSLQRLATVDTLTGLANRAHFLEQGEAELNRAYRLERPVAVLMLDIDYFKRINDTWGHAAGDLALKAISSLIAQELRAVDLCGRMGGEEFAVLLPGSDAQGGLEAADRLRRAVAKAQVKIGPGQTIPLTVSIGVAELQPGDRNIDRLLGRADRALYEAKGAGRNRVCVDTGPASGPESHQD